MTNTRRAFFNGLWRDLETAARTGRSNELDMQIRHTCAKLQEIPCNCALVAPFLFSGPLGQVPGMITTRNLTPAGMVAFVSHVHNLVNLKLDKPIFRAAEDA